MTRKVNKKPCPDENVHKRQLRHHNFILNPYRGSGGGVGETPSELIDTLVNAFSTSSYTTKVRAEAGAALSAYGTHPLKKPRIPSLLAITVAQCHGPRYRRAPDFTSSSEPRCCRRDLITCDGRSSHRARMMTHF